MQKRDLIKMGIFQILTLGLYHAYWLYQTNNELNKKGAELPSFGKYFIFLPLTIAIPLILGIPLVTNDLITNILNYNLSDLNTMSSLIMFIILSPLAYFCYKYSEAFEKYVTKDNNQMVYFVILAAYISAYVTPFAFFVPLILQHKINQSLEKI